MSTKPCLLWFLYTITLECNHDDPGFHTPPSALHCSKPVRYITFTHVYQPSTESIPQYKSQCLYNPLPSPVSTHYRSPVSITCITHLQIRMLFILTQCQHPLLQIARHVSFQGLSSGYFLSGYFSFNYLLKSLALWSSHQLSCFRWMKVLK